MVVALACYGAARFIPPTGVGAPGLKVHRNVIASTWHGDRAKCAPTTANGSAALGDELVLDGRRVTLSLVPVIIKSRIGGGIDVEIAINLIFAVGIAAGSLGAAMLSHGRIELAPAPFLLLVMAALAIDIGLATQAMAPAEPRGSARRILHERRRACASPSSSSSIPPRPACSSCRSSPRSRPGRARTGARASSARSTR